MSDYREVDVVRERAERLRAELIVAFLVSFVAAVRRKATVATGDRCALYTHSRGRHA